MPFGLRNAVTYQRMIIKIFAHQLMKTMETYMEDLLVKRQKVAEHVDHLRKMFGMLRKYKIWLNPVKCTFDMEGGNSCQRILPI